MERINRSISDSIISIIQSKKQSSHHIPLQNLLKSQCLLTLLQLIRLQPQRLGSELSERTLNPPLGLGILLNRAACTQRTRQQTSLTTHKQTSKSKKCVGCNIAESGWLEHGCKVRQVLGATVGELDRDGLFGGAEGVEHGGAVAAEADSSVETQGKAEH